MNDAFKEAGHPNSDTKASFLTLNQSLPKINHGKKSLPHIVLNIWNSLPDFLKAKECLTIYKFKFKNIFLTA